MCLKRENWIVTEIESSIQLHISEYWGVYLQIIWLVLKGISHLWFMALHHEKAQSSLQTCPIKMPPNPLACQCNYKVFKWLKIITFRFLLFFCLINLQLHRITSISLSQSFIRKHSAGENFTRQKHLRYFDSFVGFLFLWEREMNKNKIACHDFYDLLPLAINMKSIFLKYSYFCDTFS